LGRNASLPWRAPRAATGALSDAEIDEEIGARLLAEDIGTKSK
jgi:hypothetical protein